MYTFGCMYLYVYIYFTLNCCIILLIFSKLHDFNELNVGVIDAILIFILHIQINHILFV